jgi:hypothetical protein
VLLPLLTEPARTLRDTVQQHTALWTQLQHAAGRSSSWKQQAGSWRQLLGPALLQPALQRPEAPGTGGGEAEAPEGSSSSSSGSDGLHRAARLQFWQLLQQEREQGRRQGGSGGRFARLEFLLQMQVRGVGG